MTMKIIIKRFIVGIIQKYRKRGCKHIANNAYIEKNVRIYNRDNIIMEESTNINSGAIIMNTRAKFIMKKWSGAAFGLTVITGGHISVPGKFHKMITNSDKELLDVNHEYDADIIVEEDVWLAANVTLLRGIRIGRGAIVGAGSVIRNNVPPYTILTGNPAKIVGFRFTPEEALIHEQALFKEDERMSIEELTNNYNKYFIKRLKEIKSFLKN